VTFAFAPVEELSDVAVVGLGIHPFGRHPGVSGLRDGGGRRARRARRRRRRLGGVDFAAGGSDAAGNADTSVSVLGLTGVPFINVKNGCATGGSALTPRTRCSRRRGRARARRRLRQAPAGRVQPAARGVGARLWYGETGLMLTTQFFAMKIQRYMAEHGISRSTLARVASKAFHNAARNENAWRRTTAVRGGRARLAGWSTTR
jgi:acetyl-CoA acetyltransferase